MSDVQEEKLQGECSRSPADTFLADAVACASMAQEVEGDKKGAKTRNLDQVRTLARASILNSAVALEAVANCCVDRGVNYPGKLGEAVKYLKVLEKYDLFLVHRGYPPLDRGKVEVQSVQELISIRNAYVHAEPTLQAVEVTNLTGGGATISPDFGKKSNFLRIEKNPNYWKSASAVSVIRAVFSFLDYYFTQLCGFDSVQTGQIICDLYRVKGNVKQSAGQLYEACFAMRKRWDMEPAFLKWIFDILRERGAL